MKHEITDYINLNNRLKELNIDKSISLSILPENIISANSEDDFVFTDTALEIKKYLNHHDIEIELLKSTDLKLKQRRAIDFFAPIVFIGYSILTENYPIVKTVIDLLSKQISDYYKGTFGKKNVKIEIVVETTPKSEYKSINYEGDIEGLKTIPEIIKSLKK
ncbi:hypothetical protein [Prolixibacter denitrificans]|uniref:Uncharacterized protein n=1 Tax=Prolixibacter denitrificans TaxID=1541063 RepID=A0A2P8C6H5_9BACT|nr:hypothetical protein [Prolixibacter denitrificans]PSK80566.1 hypothetical protein CLV93_1143 [Prolixibacter denitrificans]GET22138.1 hypothetical protein JCM18694_23840 [Prolixibacter denitrificans]